ncbi:MAG: ABC transporter substrate-binding protein [Spirochaetales bacterium]|nr:ABC transporter substrate-binding protein [Spirochaetales bacterium]
MMRKKFAVLAVALSLLLAAGAFAEGGAEKGAAQPSGKTQDTSQMRVALCNNYAGNAWRQAMIKAFEEAGQEAVSKGILKEVKVFNTAENSATEQAALLQNLVLEGYDGIVLNAASPTALNGACKAAAEAGIPVVSFDGIVTEPSAWRLNFDYPSMCYDQMVYLNKRLNGKGNILEIRGLAGTSIDDDIHLGVERGLKEFPGLKVVGTVYGSWTQTVAQKAVAGVLPTLPKVDGVATQGGDGYGCAQAFKAAGRPYPIIALGNRYDELVWWKEQHDATGYTTMSNSSPPAVSQAALWTTVEILSGADVPHDLVPPLLTIVQEELEDWLKFTPKGGVASGYFPQEWTLEFIALQKAGKPAPTIPVPK